MMAKPMLPRQQMSLVGMLAATILLTMAGCSDDETSGPGPAQGGSGAVGGGSAAHGGTGGGSGGSTPGPAPAVTKFDILSSGADSELHDAQCAAHSLPPGCDLCEALGFYDDWACDSSLVDAGLCQGPDPDCAPKVADYYLAPDGDDADDGSEQHPFATVQRAHDAAQPGDLIYLRAGTYLPTEETRFSTEATAAEPIVLMSYPGEHPIIDGSNLPAGDEEGTATWHFHGAKHWQIRGPLHLTLGRGAAVLIMGETHDVDLYFVEASHNGLTAARGGHGFVIGNAQWADARNIRFINCDAHHNANHQTRDGEDVATNLYQHGDGWRLASGQNVQLIGCRGWHNLDDNFDSSAAAHPVSLHQFWSAYAGRDDASGSITGTADYDAGWGEGIKLSYPEDTVAHRVTRSLSWSNVHLGFRMDGGPHLLENCTAYDNGLRALGWELAPANTFHNCIDLDNPNDSQIPNDSTSSHNSWDGDSSFAVAHDDFASLDDSTMFGPRSSDGSLPVTDFMRLAPGSDLIDAGREGQTPFNGAAPDIGCLEHP